MIQALAVLLLLGSAPDGRLTSSGQEVDWRVGGQYDFDRPPPGSRYYFADKFYRYDPKYVEYRMTMSERIYRGRDAHTYCRRTDGTTGIVKGPGLAFVRHTLRYEGDSSLISSAMNPAYDVGAPIPAGDPRRELRCTR